MKTEIRKACGECGNCIPYKSGEFSLLCTKFGIEVAPEDVCSDFTRVYEICSNCGRTRPLKQTSLLCVKREDGAGIEVALDWSCKDFTSKTRKDPE